MMMLMLKYFSFADKQKVELLELSQLEKEYLLLDARLRLIRKNPDPSLMSGKSFHKIIPETSCLPLFSFL